MKRVHSTDVATNWKCCNVPCLRHHRDKMLVKISDIDIKRNQGGIKVQFESGSDNTIPLAFSFEAWYIYILILKRNNPSHANYFRHLCIESSKQSSFKSNQESRLLLMDIAVCLQFQPTPLPGGSSRPWFSRINRQHIRI